MNVDTRALAGAVSGEEHVQRAPLGQDVAEDGVERLHDVRARWDRPGDLLRSGIAIRGDQPGGVAQQVTERAIAARTARSVKGVVRTMFRDAKLEGVVAVDPFPGLPRQLLPKLPRRERQVYSREEVALLVHSERITPR
jgi:hypothetical protein